MLSANSRGLESMTLWSFPDLRGNAEHLSDKAEVSQSLRVDLVSSEVIEKKVNNAVSAFLTEANFLLAMRITHYFRAMSANNAVRVDTLVGGMSQALSTINQLAVEAERDPRTVELTLTRND